MRTATRHYLLALLMIFQSVSAAWPQLPITAAQPAAAQAMQQGEHCAMMAKRAANASEFQEIAAKTAKSDCPCCEKQCVPMNCAGVNLQLALSVFSVIVQFAPTALTTSRFAEGVDTTYFRPPTPPPNTLQS